MDDNDRTPTFAADRLEAHIEASLQELAAGKGRPMSAFRFHPPSPYHFISPPPP